MPGVLQVEAMTQLAEMAVWKKLDPKREGEIYLKALRRVKFRRPVNPGDRLHIEAEVKSVSGDSAEVSATVRTNSGPSCQAEISLAVRPRVQPAKMPAPFSNYDKSEGIHMDINKLMAVIPHRYPFLLVDYIQSVEGCRVTAVKNVTSSEPLLREYPDKYLALTNSVLPEIIAQTGCVYMLSNESAKGKIAYFMAIEKAEFLKPIHPGDQLVCIIDIPDNKSRFGKGDGFIQVDGETVAKTTLTFALVDPS
jgi:3-hydroxyacyl-[acyl-carrier-protein] dehydratase